MFRWNIIKDTFKRSEWYKWLREKPQVLLSVSRVSQVRVDSTGKKTVKDSKREDMR